MNKTSKQIDVRFIYGIVSIILSLFCAWKAVLFVQPAVGEQSLTGTLPYLRLHILANSDSPEDQALKLAVRDLVLREVSVSFQNIATFEEAVSFTRLNSSQFEEKVRDYLKKNGFRQSVKGEVVRENYPATAYEALKLPGGCYWSLKLTLGAGGGQNWWCVLYPPLCPANFLAGEAVPVTAEPKAGIKSHWRQAQTWRKFRANFRQDLRKIWFSQ